MNSCKTKAEQSCNDINVLGTYANAINTPVMLTQISILTGQIHGEEKWLKRPSCPVLSGELAVQFNQP